ncbi:MAG: CocE/NonD family hydrolase [Armatimonadetes bacterium]|nr:CocE/NonD family hydrolase [Armatimonadota bacterium]
MSHHSAGALGVIAEIDVEMPMRDGTILRANVFRPDAPGQFPAILTRTPYGKGQGCDQRFVRSGYVVVNQDCRGRYASDGEFQSFHIPHSQEADDGYDSVEWVAAQPYCNGRVGLMGSSYPGWLAWEAASAQPPHLVAMFASTIPVELTDLDYPGAFKAARRLHWWLVSIAPDLRRRAGWPPPHDSAEAREMWSRPAGDLWLSFLPWRDIADELPPPLGEQVRAWFDNPLAPVWRFTDKHRRVQVPNLDFTGWYDHCWSAGHLSSMQKNAATQTAREQTKVIIGPWGHAGRGNRKCGDVDFGQQAEVDMVLMTLQWFDHWLKGVDNGVEQWPACRYFVMGSGQWKASETWPPEVTARDVLYLDSAGSANPVAAGASLVARPPEVDHPDEYTYDPRNPVPTLWDAAMFTQAPDRRRLEHRRDILIYRTEPLQEDLEVVGCPEVVLYASSSAPDTDFFARLVDDGPDGIALEVCYGFLRARFRKGFEREELLTPGEVTEFAIRLGPTAVCFKAGHRIRLEITSSDFPCHDRNHNTGGDDLIETQLVTARQRVHHSAAYPSRLILPRIGAEDVGKVS